jgi:uncharacterized protein (UPF0276 family)
VAFVDDSDLSLGHLSPVAWTQSSLENIRDNLKRWQDICQRPVLLENITAHLNLPSTVCETDFLNELCEKCNCGLLLDITNLYVNSRNHGYCPYAWLSQINPDVVKQLHIVGYSETSHGLEDFHESSVQPELITLLAHTLELLSPEFCILERDNKIPSVSVLQQELEAIKRVIPTHQQDLTYATSASKVSRDCVAAGLASEE